ncbi:hypothetical protein JW978_01540 [Candidatus Dojkabacteria bacterium]|nr:hypothetical protein [Candidatus Dojkabacteria bacterium]
MKIIKAPFIFTIFIILLLAIGFGLLRLVNSGVFPLSLSNNQDEDSNDFSSITLSSLLGKSIGGDLLLLKSSENGLEIIQYKISTSRQKLIAGFDNVQVGEPELNVELVEDSIYILAKEDDNLVLKTAKNESNAEVKTLFEQKDIPNALGLKIFDGKALFTSYLINIESGGYDFDIFKFDLKSEKLEVILSGNSSTIPLIGQYSTKENIYLEQYSLQYESFTRQCQDLELNEIDCFQASKLDEQYFSQPPAEDGFAAGQNAKIISQTKDEEKIVLEGELNKYFGSVMRYKNEIYFISGDLESFRQNEAGDAAFFEEFEPVFLEKYGLENEVRTSLSDLPASSSVKIELISGDFILLSVVQSGRNSLWLYNIDKDELGKIDDIECESVTGCQQYYLNN